MLDELRGRVLEREALTVVEDNRRDGLLRELRKQARDRVGLPKTAFAEDQHVGVGAATIGIQAPKRIFLRFQVPTDQDRPCPNAFGRGRELIEAREKF